MVQLRKTNKEDSDFLALVKKLDADLSISDGDEHAFYDQFNKVTDIKHILVAYLDHVPVGCGAIKHFDEKSIEIKRMFVSPESRGKGIASMVLSTLEEWAAELGYIRCILETGLKQPEAISLYKKNKYIVIDNYGQYKGVENSVCFEKLL